MRTTHDAEEPRLLTLDDVEQAAQVIAQAYVEDPLVNFMLPNRKTRTGTLLKAFRIIGELSIRGRRGYGIGTPLQGVAYWKSPEEEDLSISMASLGRFLPLLFTQYPLGLVRARAVNRRIDAMHRSYADRPHYYLDNIGVQPSAQGQGLASRLIRPFLEKADSRQVIVYTDTVTRTNVSLYEHFGFERVEEASIAGTGITVWGLRRPPA